MTITRDVLEDIEVLYHRLNWRVVPQNNRRIVETWVAGVRVHFTFVKLLQPTVEAAIDLAERLEQERVDRTTTIVVSDVPVESDIRTWLEHVADGPYSARQWFMRAINAEEVCAQTVSEYQKIWQRGGQFVEPLVTPISFADVKARFVDGSGVDTSGEFVLLLGPAGFGKTVISHEIARRAADHHAADPERPVPILIAVESHREGSWEDLLSAFARRVNAAWLTPSALQFLLSRHAAVLIIDGLDELAERGGLDAAARTLANLVDNLHGGRVLLTAREGYRDLFQKVVEGREKQCSFATVRGIDPAFVEHLLPDFDPSVRAATADIIRSGATGNINNDLRFSLFRNPMVVRFVAEALADDLESLPELIADAKTGSSALLARVFENVLRSTNDREIDRQSIGVDSKEYVELFGELAIKAITSGAASELEDPLSVPGGFADMRAWIDIRLDGENLTEPQRIKLASRWEMSLQNHPIVQYERPNDGELVLRFRHEFFRDAAAALFIAEKVTSSGHVLSPLVVGGAKITSLVGSRLATELTVDQLRLLLDSSRGTSRFPYLLQALAHKLVSLTDDDVQIAARDLLSSWRGTFGATVTFQNIDFSGSDMSGSDLTAAVFDRCRFVDIVCSDLGITNASFYRCVSDEQFVKYARASAAASLPTHVVSNNVGTNQAPDPVHDFTITVIKSLFEKFLRSERGMHQRSVAEGSFVRGVPYEVGEFIKEYALGLAQAYGIVDYVAQVRVYKFISSFQAAADAIVFDNNVHPDFDSFFEDLKSRAHKYIG
jgi:hypothetical protein